jgi:DNA-binding CsgD family transcriptional regulator
VKTRRRGENDTYNTADSLSDVEKKWIKLSQREKEFIQFGCTEDTYAEIASKMFVAPKTVDGYRDAAFEKLGVKNRIGLILFVIRNKLITISNE